MIGMGYDCKACLDNKIIKKPDGSGVSIPCPNC